MSRTFLLFVLVAAACGTTANRPTAGTAPVDSAGIAIVNNTKPLWAEGKGRRVDSVPVTSIGGDESDPQQHFQYVFAAVRTSDGRVVIAVGGELRWFGADGKYQRTTTKAGQGPGEFRDIASLVRLPGDSLMATGEYLFRKVAIYAPDGSPAHDEMLDLDRYQKLGTEEEGLMGVLPDRSRFRTMLDPSIPFTATNRKHVDGDPGPGLLRTVQRLYIVPPSLDTAYAIGLTTGIEQFGIAVNGRTTRWIQHPFYGHSFVAAVGTPMRLALVTNPAYSVEIWTPTGKLERIIRRVGGRRAPTAIEKADVPAGVEKMMRRMHDMTSIDRVMSVVPTPDSLPAAIGLVIGAGGEIVVQREGYLPSHKASLFDVFNADGGWLGEIRLPPRVRLLEMGADYLLGVRIDDDDVSHVEVYRLRR